MADTIQVVRWNLAQVCPLRNADEWGNPAVETARYFSANLLASRNQGGVCVTHVRYAGDWKRSPRLTVPDRGFFVQDIFGSVGGADGLMSLCRSCPANTCLPSPAGCGGHISLAPYSAYSTELNDKLCDVVRDLGLETEVARIFKPAKLLWFSFWMESLLSRQAMEVLRPLLQLFAVRQFGKERFPHNLRDFSRFDRALIAAMEHDIPLLVEMTPPGHTDFGHITTFAHCPTCRAAAPVEKWKKIRPFQHVCTVCGHEYNPASTLASTPESPEVHERLVNLLGEELFREFTANHLLQLGASPEETASAIAEFLAPPDPGIEERNRRTREVAREKLHFMQTAIFADCSLLREGAAPENITSPSYLLNRAEAENVLGRCRRWGVTVLRIGHYIDEFDEPLVRCIDFGSPETTLAALGTEDHNALFFLILHISDEALANWKDGEESRPPTPSQS